MIASIRALTVGYHGCDRSVGEQILAGKANIKKSANSYDWLGHGAYFWEDNEQRAWEWARHQAGLSKIRTPFVIGAVIDLSRCLDLTSGDTLDVVRNYHQAFVEDLKSTHTPIPENTIQAPSGEWLLRNLDCAVIEFLHKARKGGGLCEYASVRGVFFEGGPLYPGAGFREKNHIQICVRDTSTVLGYFLPSK